MVVLNSFKRKAFVIIALIADVLAIVVFITSTNKTSFTMNNIIHSGYFWIAIIITVSIIVAIVYWYIKQLVWKIKILEKRQLMISAILTHNTNVRILQFPNVDVVRKVGLTKSDLLFFGYPKEQVEQYHLDD